MTFRILAWLPFPVLIVLLILAEWRAAGSTGISLAPLLLGPAVLVYLLALPFLHRGLRAAPTRRVAAFSLLAAALWVVLELLALWLISGPMWGASGHVSDLLFFWFLPWAPAALALWLAYRWAIRTG